MAAEIPVEPGTTYAVTASFDNGPTPGLGLFVVRLTDDAGGITMRHLRAKNLWRAARKAHRDAEPGWRVVSVEDIGPRPLRLARDVVNGEPGPVFAYVPPPRRGTRKVRRSDG